MISVPSFYLGLYPSPLVSISNSIVRSPVCRQIISMTSRLKALQHFSVTLRHNKSSKSGGVVKWNRNKSKNEHIFL
jgi:hypothetical protein